MATDEGKMPKFGKGDKGTRTLPSGATGVKHIKSPALDVSQAKTSKPGARPNTFGKK